MERALVERARSGERDAFDALVRCKVDAVYRSALAILGHEADAADATQEAFVSAWKNIRDLRDPDLFDAWLGRIAVNACRGALRRRSRATVREISIAPGPDGRPPLELADGAARSIDEAAATADLFDRAFARLGADDRALLVMHHLEERPVSAIAFALGIPSGTVKSRLYRARAALETALAKESR